MPNWVKVAIDAWTFTGQLEDGRVFRTHRNGVSQIPGFLEDYAALGLGFVALYQLTFGRVWLDWARSLANSIVAHFWSESAGAFFDTADDAEELVTRPRDVTDNAIPSGTSLAVELLLILGDLFGDASYREKATRVLETIAEPMARYPTGFGHALGAADPVRGMLDDRKREVRINRGVPVSREVLAARRDPVVLKPADDCGPKPGYRRGVFA